MLNIRRSIAAAGAVTALVGASVLSASPAMADAAIIPVYCGQQESPALGPRTAIDFETSCKPLAGNVTGWTIKGTLFNSRPISSMKVRIDVIINGKHYRAIAKGGTVTPKEFSFSNSSTSVPQVAVCTPNALIADDSFTCFDA